MKTKQCLALCATAFTAVALSGCTSIPHHPIQDRTTYYMCLEKNSTKKHYASNTFAIQPTPEQKQYEALLVKRRLEKFLNIPLTECRETPKNNKSYDIELLDS